MLAKVKRRLLCAVSVAISLTIPSVVAAETLTDALVSAYQNSGLLDQNRAVLRAADEDVAQAVSTLRPVIGYAGASNYNTSDSVVGERLSSSLSLSADLTLYDFGRRQLALEAAKETVLATREALIAIEQQVLLRAVQAYMNVRRDAEFVALGENNVRLITQELRAARDRFEVGEVTRTDVAIAEARLAASRANLAAAQGSLAQAREEYNAAVGRYPDQLAPPPAAPQTAASLESARAIALQNHPDIRESQRLVTVADLNVQRARTQLNPTLSLSGDAGVDDDGTNTSSIGLSLGGTIYQGGQLRSLQRSAIANRDASRAQLHLAGDSVVQNVGNAWAILLVARASIEATDRQITASRIAYLGTKEEATLGARTTLDVLDAEQELLDAQANRISAETDAQVAAYQLLSSMGYLTVKHLGLGVTTYDPAEYYNAVRNAPSRPVSEQGTRLDNLLRRTGRN